MKVNFDEIDEQTEQDDPNMEVHECDPDARIQPLTQVVSGTWAGMRAGPWMPLARIEVETLYPEQDDDGDDAAIEAARPTGVRITFVAEDPDDPEGVEIANVILRRDDLADFASMLPGWQSAKPAK